jgi:hypothetical protein
VTSAISISSTGACRPSAAAPSGAGNQRDLEGIFKRGRDRALGDYSVEFVLRQRLKEMLMPIAGKKPAKEAAARSWWPKPQRKSA